MDCFVKNSLNSLLVLPQTRPQNVSGLELRPLTERINDALSELGRKNSLKLAIEFYALNHLVGLIKARVHPDMPLSGIDLRVVEQYQEALIEQSERLFWYMLLIVTRESRHAQNITDEQWEALSTKHGEQFLSFFREILGEDGHDAVEKFKYYAHNLSLGRYLTAVEDVFLTLKFEKGFGGKPWANITNCLRQMVEGKTSLEIMTDTAYTLAHNNGPMFNKGMLYTEQNPDLIRVLDVQRSGQIPEAVLASEFSDVPVDVRKLVSEYQQAYPETFRGWVDWYVVEPSSDHDYEYYKQVQIQSGHGPEKPQTVGKVEWPGLSVNITVRSQKVA